MKLNHHINLKIQRFQLFEQIQKDDCAPSSTVPTFPYIPLLVLMYCQNI